MELSYLTVARDGEAEIEVKRSRFRATIRRVAAEADARALTEGLRKRHWDARHHCTAFRLGPPPAPTERSNDDGEPAGTAGAPMLDVLRGAGVSDVAVVVTRWFGGTLLGAGGLVRAYSDAVRVALDEVGLRRRELLQEWTVTIAYAAAGRLETELRTLGYAVLDVRYGEAVTLRVGAEPGQAARLADVLAGLTAGAVRPDPAGESWVDR